MQPAKRVRRRPVEDLRSMLLRALENGGSALYVFETGVFPTLGLLDWYGLARTEIDPDGPIHTYIRENNVWLRMFDRDHGNDEVLNRPDLNMSQFIRAVFDPNGYPQLNPLWAVLAYEVYLSVENNYLTTFMFPHPLNSSYVQIDTMDYLGNNFYQFNFRGPSAVVIYARMEDQITEGMGHWPETQYAYFFISIESLAIFLRRVYELFRYGLRLTHANGITFGLNNKGLSCKVCNQTTELQCPETKELYCSEKCHIEAGC